MYLQPDILESDSNEYFQLKVACQILEELATNVRFEIEDVYFDAGQDWMWTTIIAHNLVTDNSFQCLNPRDWKEIINDSTNAQIREVCKGIIARYPKLYNIYTIKVEKVF